MHDVEDIGAYYHTILPFYDASLADRGDLPFWDSIVRRWGARRILELGCGTGRVTEVLSRLASVTAADLLIEMLGRARQRVPAVNLVVADLRTFVFLSPFDLIVLANDPMAHLTSAEERMHVIRRIADHLTPDGRVVIEGLSRPRNRKRSIGNFALEESWEPADSTGLWNATYRYREGSKVTEARSVMRSWTVDELDHFGDAGLDIEHLWSDFDEHPFGGESERIVIVACMSRS
jgi:SAM-dependent methyltransferase